MTYRSENLVIHYHAPIFVDADGKKFVAASFGVWLEEIARYFSTVTYVGPSATEQGLLLKHQISAENIQLNAISHGYPYVGWLLKRRRYRKALFKQGGHTVLLVRGHTPMQGVVWNAASKKMSRHLLLVRELKQKRYLSGSWVTFIIASLVNKMREREMMKLLSQADSVNANSVNIIEELANTVGLSATLTTTNPISSKDLVRREKSRYNKNINILFVGRVSEMKGALDLARTFESLHNRLNGYNISFTFVGEVDPDIQSKIQSQAQSNVTPIFIGVLGDRQKLLKEYRNADIFVLPTHSEGFARVLWEAASQMVPIITCAVGGIPYVFKNGESALLVQAQDAVKLTDAIADLIVNPGKARYLAENAFEVVKNNTIEVGVQRLCESMSMRSAGNNLT